MEFEQIWESIRSSVAIYALHVIGAILTLIIGFWIIARITRIVKKSMEGYVDDEALRNFLGTLVSLLLKAMLILSVLSMFGVEATSFIAIFSALAFAIGLALQGNLANFASGVLILIFKFFKTGDFVEIGGHAGTVRDIHIFHTELVALDNRIIFIPNGQVTGNAIQNYTIQGVRRHDLTVGIGYDDDIDKARQIIEDIVKGLPDIELDAGYDIFVKELADSSVNFAVRFMAKNENFWPAYKLFFERIKKEFDANDIGIPFPQMDVHLDKAE